MREIFNLIVLGDPAAGKATQAKRLAAKYGMFDFDMGRELRALKLRANSQTRKSLEQTLDRGKLTPTEIVRRIHKNLIFSTPKNKGILFDGTPKMIGEARLVYKWLQQTGRNSAGVLVLYIKIPKREIIKRMLARKEYLQGKYAKRRDDNRLALSNRIKYYRKDIAAVVRFFKSKYTFRTVNGLGSRARVYGGIKTIVNEFVNKKSGRDR